MPYEDEVEWHQDGQDVPLWFVVLLVFAVCVLVPMVLFLLFGLPFGPEAH